MFGELSEEWDRDLRSGDPLGFPGYADRLATLEAESVRTGVVGRGEHAFVLIEGDFDVIGGSMGLVHGEKVVRAFDRAVERQLPVVVVTRSGGARMQEGMVSLVQMARTSAAARRHSRAGLLSVAIHRSPTTGGVFASYGSLADLRVAEAGATVGFAGPRVVSETTGTDVDGRSHTAETAWAAGLVDAVVPTEGLRAWVDAALGWTAMPLELDPLTVPIRQVDPGVRPDGSLDAWQQVRRARALGRPSGVHVAAALCSSWVEMGAGQDPALRVALATIDNRRVVVIANDRYGRPNRPTPAGYRLAQRGLALAERCNLPVLTLVDTPGADPDPEAENDAIAGEIARTFAALSEVPVPTISVCVGEGGSGGALALAATDVLLIQEHAIFSVIAPEGAAAILERDAAKAPELTPSLKLTSADLLDLGVVDGVTPDGMGATVDAVRDVLAAVSVDATVIGHRLVRFDAVTGRWLRGDGTTPA